jgi:hypothetical protein
LLSVSAAAWKAGNPFNGTVFLLAAVATIVLASRSDRAVTMASTGRMILGGGMIAFGWLYPHFLEGDDDLRYLWAAPLGLIPCPSLSLTLGVLLLLEAPAPRTLLRLLGGLGAFYGLLGWLWLGVTVDVALLVGSSILLSTTARRPAEVLRGGDGILRTAAEAKGSPSGRDPRGHGSCSREVDGLRSGCRR